MASLFGGGSGAGTVTLTIDNGGAEDGVPTAAASPVTLTCKRENYSEAIEPITQADTGRCDTWDVTAFIRAKGTITLSVPVQTDGTCYLGDPSGVNGSNRYYYIARTYGTSGDTATWLTAIRSNTISVSDDGKVVQNCTFEVKGVTVA